MTSALCAVMVCSQVYVSPSGAQTYGHGTRQGRAGQRISVMVRERVSLRIRVRIRVSLRIRVRVRVRDRVRVREREREREAQSGERNATRGSSRLG